MAKDESEASFDVPKDALEDRFPVAVHRVPVRLPCPVGAQVAEEAALRMRLYPEYVPVSVAEGRDVESRPTRVPRVSSVFAAIIDETEHDLIVFSQLLQDTLLAALGEQKFAFVLCRTRREDLARLAVPCDVKSVPTF